jgi:enoyl-CoA hydratase/carnithine racemase
MSEIIMEKKDKIGFVTLNRPEQWNTFNVSLARQLNDCLNQMDLDDEIRVIIIKANGKNFSTGIDLNEFSGKTHEEYRKMIKIMDEHNHTISKMKKPVIAEVQGYVLANGAGLAFACDMAVAGESARFGTTAINVGLICLGPALPLSKLVGRKKVLEMVLTGEIISSQEAYQLGLVNKVVPDGKLEEETINLAQLLASKSPLALQAGKQGIYAMQDIPYHQAADYMSEIFASLASTEDAQEGIKAFKEKRSPKFKG